MRFVVAASRPGYEEMTHNLAQETGHSFLHIGAKESLNLDFLKEISPRKIFFPHWSYIIPREVFESFDCVIFHMTDLPFGRGGSPLQNLIARGIAKTKISALKCVAELDAGPIYLKRELSLDGSAQEIFDRARPIIREMIEFIVKNDPQPVPQSGDPVTFVRRKAVESDISQLDDIRKAYDFIRMLDAEGYPHAYIETEHFRFEFRQARQEKGEVHAQVLIKPRPKDCK